MVCVIDQRTVIYLTNLCDKLTPLLLLVLGAYHLAADAQHFAACVFGYLRIVADESCVAGKPLVPVAFQAAVLVINGEFSLGESDIRSPCAVLAVEDRLEADFQSAVLELLDGSFDLPVGINKAEVHAEA